MKDKKPCEMAPELYLSNGHSVLIVNYVIVKNSDEKLYSTFFSIFSPFSVM